MTALVSIVPTTKADVLLRAKTAIENGYASFREAAELLAGAKRDHGATQREMAAAVGKSLGWVNAMLQWRNSNYQSESPFRAYDPGRARSAC